MALVEPLALNEPDAEPAAAPEYVEAGSELLLALEVLDGEELVLVLPYTELLLGEADVDWSWLERVALCEV